MSAGPGAHDVLDVALVSGGRWTQDEWDAVAFLLEKGWKGDLTDEDLEAYLTLLAGVQPAAVVAGLQRLVRHGKPFTPTVSEIVQAAQADDGTPSWPEAWGQIFGRGGIVHARSGLRTYRTENERVRADEDAMLERSAACHPFIASFVHAVGIARLRTLPVHDHDWGELERRRLGEEWAEHVDRVEARRRAGIPLQLPTPAAARAALDAGRPAGLRKLNAGGLVAHLEEGNG